MNIFAQLEELEDLSGTKVTYYTVRFEGREHNELEDFIVRHQANAKIRDEFADLLRWMQRIGNRTGAQPRYFRHEGKAFALPPAAGLLEIKYTENLRLYCLPVSEGLVVLFNGGVKTKTARTADDCPVVRPYFKQAQRLAQAIDGCIRQKDITPDLANRKLIFEPDFTLEI